MDNLNFNREKIQLGLETAINETSKLITDSKAKFLIFPFVVILGTIEADSTDYHPLYQQTPQDAQTQKEIFSGENSILAKWENAEFVENEKDSQGNITNRLKRTLRVGDYFQGVILSKSLTYEFTPWSSNTEFINLQNLTTITVLCNEKRYSNQDGFNRFFIIAEFTGTNQSNWLYLKNIEEYFDQNGNWVYSQYTFYSVADMISKTGFSIDNYIQKHPAGENYAWPLIVQSEDKKSVDIQLDPNALKWNLIRYVEIQNYGAGVDLGSHVIGHEVEQDANDPNVSYMNCPSELLIERFYAGTLNNLAIYSKPINQFFMMADINADMLTFYSSWQANVEANYNLQSTKTYEGALTSNYDNTIATNPINSDGKYTFLLQDNGAWQFGDFASQLANIDVKSNSYFTTSYLKTDNTQYGIQIFSLDTSEVSIVEIYNFMIFINSTTSSLPIGIKTITPVPTGSLPIIGLFLRLISLGIPWGWQNVNSSLHPKNRIIGLIGCDFYEFWTNAKYKPDTQRIGYIDLVAFRSDGDSVINQFGLNVASVNIAMKLSNIIKGTAYYEDGTIVNDKILKIYDLGQLLTDQTVGKKYWNGLSNKSKVQPYLLDTDMKGFVIDALIFKRICYSTYRLLCYHSEPNPSSAIWQSSFKTKSSLTNSVRDILTVNRFSAYLNINGEPINYPQPINPPSPNYFPYTLLVNLSVTASMTTGLHPPLTETIERGYFIELTVINQASSFYFTTNTNDYPDSQQSINDTFAISNFQQWKTIHISKATADQYKRDLFDPNFGVSGSIIGGSIYKIWFNNENNFIYFRIEATVIVRSLPDFIPNIKGTIFSAIFNK